MLSLTLEMALKLTVRYQIKRKQIRAMVYLEISVDGNKHGRKAFEKKGLCVNHQPPSPMSTSRLGSSPRQGEMKLPPAPVLVYTHLESSTGGHWEMGG